MMNSNRFLAGLLVLVAVAALGSSLWVGTSIGELRRELSAVKYALDAERNDAKSQRSDILKQLARIAGGDLGEKGDKEGVVDPQSGVALRKANDIKARIDVMVSGWTDPNKSMIDKITERANLLNEVDAWLYAPEEHEAANVIINNEIAVLRNLIREQVATLSEDALKAENGRIAAKIMQQINGILNLYPMPSSTVESKRLQEQEALEKLTERILATSRRVEEIRYLRYNQWAIERIEDGLKRYRFELEMHSIKDIGKLVRTNRDKLRIEAIGAMSKVDTAFLNPSAMDLYNYVYGLYRDAMGSDEENRINLARGFSKLDVTRKAPLDF